MGEKLGWLNTVSLRHKSARYGFLPDTSISHVGKSDTIN